MAAVIERGWYYWGCVERAGHQLHRIYLSRDGRPVYMRQAPYNHYFSHFDNTLVLPGAAPMQASLTRFASLGYTALAFPDLTGDSRGGSNSIIFAPSTTITAQGIVDSLPRVVPQLVARWPAIDLSRITYEPAPPKSGSQA